MDTSDVRVRFAPSPTGLLHIGGVRSALFNYLFAKHHNGTFILRLEDTDRERFVEEGVTQIQEGLKWLGLIPDEGYWLGEHKGDHGPYVQSARIPTYERYVAQMLEDGCAYRSTIDPDAYNGLREQAIANGTAFVYKRTMEPDTAPGEAPLPVRVDTVALAQKLGEELRWTDENRGEFVEKLAGIEDFVIMKADGYPTYNFANVVDDHLMHITHILRGDEFIASTAKHALLYDYFEWSRPKFVHLPPILGEGGKKKLSKRDGDVDVLEYRAHGYLTEALINFLALLGWNDGTEQELFTLEELIEKFSLERVQKSPAVFDKARLDWMNGKWVREHLSLEELVSRITPYVPAEWTSDADYLKSVIALDRDRIKTLETVPELIDFFFVTPKLDRALLTKKTASNKAADILKDVTTELNNARDFREEQIEVSLRGFIGERNLHAGEVFYLLRIALTGRTEAPGIFETMATLGKEVCIERITRALELLTDTKQ